MTLHITHHAVERYQERVANLPAEQVIELLSSPTIRKAAEIGCTGVILGTGHRVVIEDNSIITVHPRPRVKRRRYGRREREE